MDSDLMIQTQESDAEWRLGPGEALRLDPAAVPRVVTVTAGRLWFTGSGTDERPAPDVWLGAGQSATLAPGEEAVVEAWPLARFAVLEAPAAEGRRVSVARAASWVRHLRERLQWAPPRAACSA